MPLMIFIIGLIIFLKLQKIIDNQKIIKNSNNKILTLLENQNKLIKQYTEQTKD